MNSTGMDLEKRIDALKRDLLSFDGPQISTVRNYNFALLVYDPAQELELRRRVQELTAKLKAEGWEIQPVTLQRMLFDRLEKLGAGTVASFIDREKRLAARDRLRALSFLKEKLAQQIEGPDGLAADVAGFIREFCAKYPDKANRTAVFIGHLGALYPCFRTSALLKHLAGQIPNVPVVILYPGTYTDGGLSFMGQIEPDRDYRPRIYA